MLARLASRVDSEITYSGPRTGRTREAEKEFCVEAILMTAGLIQLPVMIASVVVGVCATKTPSSVNCGCATV
eukprot:scaffold3031_cov49-Cyclotella_meneghiniana.AAC.6